MNAYIYAFLVFSIVLNIFFLFRLQLFKRCTRRVTSILREIRLNNSNRRVHIGTRSHELDELVAELNSLMDRFGETIERKLSLEIANKKLIANISHDIRTPLTSLLGFVEVLQKDEDLSYEDRKRFMDIIERKGHSLYNLIQEFFELSKLESEDTAVRFEKNNLPELVKGVLASYYNEFVNEHISLEIQLPDNPVHVWGDATSIERIMQNLISNALKYGKGGGKIGVALREESDKVWLDVWDNGKGISEPDLKFIFDRLYTVESSRNEKLQGSGLGLAITKKLVEKQKGEITAASIPYEKTQFSFSLLRYR